MVPTSNFCNPLNKSATPNTHYQPNKNSTVYSHSPRKKYIIIIIIIMKKLNKGIMALGLVADSGRLGFKKVWGRDEGWVVYGFKSGSELCGLEWEMKWWEGGSEKWGWSAREMSGSDCFHEWIGVRKGKRKLTVRRVHAREVHRVRIGTEKWVDQSLELLRSVCGSFSWSSVCGSELVKLCVRVRELRPVRVRELSGKCLK